MAPGKSKSFCGWKEETREAGIAPKSGKGVKGGYGRIAGQLGGADILFPIQHYLPRGLDSFFAARKPLN
jgi:hypothetical protein